MSQDWIERDRLLSETHSDVKHLVEWSKAHTADDDKRFKEVKADIETGKKLVWGGAGIIVALEFVMKLFK